MNNTQPQKQQSELELGDPAISMFFKSIAATVSGFTAIHKAKIKAEIMKIVSDYEIKESELQASTSTGQVHSEWVEASNYTRFPPTTSYRCDRSLVDNIYISSEETSVRSQSANSYIHSPDSYDSN